MKKQNYLLSIFVFLLILTSCNSDDNSDDVNETNSNIRPSSFTVTEVGDNPYTINFEYLGNLISQITTSFGSTTTYNYSGDQLTDYSINRNGQIETVNLTYENGRLIRSENEDGSDIIQFFYNGNGQINKTDWDGEITFYQYDGAGNVNQSEDDFATFKYIYDSNNNAFRNVFPQLDAEVSWEWFGSQINNQIEVQRKLTTDTEFATRYTYEYDYNDNNFPVERRTNFD